MSSHTQFSSYGDVIVSPHALANAAGLAILELGGNAVDAAIAVNAALGVVAPETCGVGGDLFALVHQPGTSIPKALNASGRSGSGADAELLADVPDIPLNHPMSVTIPGCVDGWLELNRVFGALPLDTILAPAIALARRGFPASDELSSTLDRFADDLRDQAASGGLYPSGSQPGGKATRPALADTLDQIGSGRRDEFYGGALGLGISQATGGIITVGDLEQSQADWIAPISTELWGRTAWTIPPNSQGYLTLATLKIFDALDAPQDPGDPLYQHLMIEAYRCVAQERDIILADSDSMEDIELLSSSRLEVLGSLVQRSKASRFSGPDPRVGGTAFMCVVDASGLGISLIQSNFHGIGSRIGVGRGGFFLHNRGAGFNLTPGHPNALAPNKRPLHTLAPTLWTNGPDLEMILGTRGGHQQPQLLAQVGALVMRDGLNPGDAQMTPRWTTSVLGAGSASQLLVESSMSEEIRRSLTAFGHDVELGAPMMGSAGPVSLITQTQTGLRTGASDPRVDTAAVSVR